MLTEEEFTKTLQTAHLVLLVGGNPLPAYVAARLLARPGARIWLLHSELTDQLKLKEQYPHAPGLNEPSTKAVADRLEKMLRAYDASWKICPVSISTFDNYAIAESLNKGVFKDIPPGERVGINYSGGTKPMALHVYRSFDRYGQNPLVCSYLDPHNLTLVVDGDENHRARPIPILRTDFLREKLRLSLTELTRLHRCQPALPHEREQIRKEIRQEEWHASVEPGYHALADMEKAIANIYQDDSRYASHTKKKAWKDWLDSFLDVSKEAQYKRAFEEAKRRLDCQAFLNHFKVQDLDVALPTDSALNEVRQAMEAICEGAGALTPGGLASRIILKKNRLVSCRKWFTGGWLEDYAASAFEAALQKLNPGGTPIPPDTCGRNLLYRPEEGGVKECFELDAAALIGYQLFAVSCTNSDEDRAEAVLDKRRGNVGHLLEIYVRARQLGGDEARIALVCRSENPEDLQSQFRHQWDAEGKVRVFGVHHLPDLAEHFCQWLCNATGSSGGSL